MSLPRMETLLSLTTGPTWPPDGGREFSGPNLQEARMETTDPAPADPHHDDILYPTTIPFIPTTSRVSQRSARAGDWWWIVLIVLLVGAGIWNRYLS
jgi:hypothetical protein